MKKISLLLLMLLVGIGSTWADGTGTKYVKGDQITSLSDLTAGNYIIEVKSEASTDLGTLWYTAYSTTLTNENNWAIHTTTYPVEANHVWTLAYADGGSAGTNFTLYNLSDPSNVYFPAAYHSHTFYATPAIWTLHAITNDYAKFSLSLTNEESTTSSDAAGTWYFHSDQGSGMTSTTNGRRPSFWGAPDTEANVGVSGSCCGINFYKAVEQSVATYDITYDFYIGETKVGTSGAITVYNGDAYPEIKMPSDFNCSSDYYTLSDKPSGTVSADETVKITVTQNTPFTSATTFDASSAKWYTMKISAAGNYLSYVADQTYIDLSTTTTEYADADQFCFVGNIFTGFKIYNKAAGDGYLLSSATPTTDKTWVYMVDATTAQTQAYLWDATKSSNIDGGFYLGIHGTTYRMNKQDGKLCYWLTGADAGSTFQISEVTESAARLALKDAIATANTMVGSTVGLYPQTAIDAAQAVYDDQTKTDEECTTATTTLQAARVMPTSGRVYMLVSAYPGYMTSQSVEKAVYDNNGTSSWKTLDKTDQTMYWYIAPDAAGTGYTIKNYSTGNYLSDYAATSTTETSWYLKDLAVGTYGYEFGISKDASLGTWNFLHTDGHNSGAGVSGNTTSWSTGADGASAWYIREVDDPELESAKAALQAKVDEYDTSNTYMYGINPGQKTITGITSEALSSALSAAQAVLDGGSKIAKDYTDALTTLNTALADATITTNSMTVGKYYRIQSTTRETYTGLNMNNSNHTGDSKMWNYTLDETDPRQIWQLEQDGDNYYLVNVCSGTYPQYVNGGSTNTTYVGAKNESYKFTWDANEAATTTSYPSWNINFGGRRINIESDGYVNWWTGENSHQYIWTVDKTADEILTLVKAWATTQNYTANAGTEKKYTIDENATLISPSEYAATLVPAAIDAVDAYANAETPTLAQAQALYNNYQIVADYVSASNSYGAPLSCDYTATEGWNTIIMPVNFSVPSTWTLYTCAAVDGKVLTLTAATDGQNKNTPFIVKSTQAETFQIIGYSNGAATENVTEGLLTGVITSAKTSNGYVLSDNAKSMANVSAETEVAKYHCYMPADESLTEDNYYFDKSDVPTTEVTAYMYISDAGWATFCAPFAVEIPEGVKAYTAELAEDNSWVKLTAVEGTTIPAGTPVVLEGAAFNSEKTFTDVPTTTKTTVQKGCLTGNLSGAKVGVTENKDNYLLQKQNVVGWYKVTESGLQIGNNRCYMTLGQDVNARQFIPMSIDETTAIRSIAAEAATKADGKYLVNGKIVVVKAGKAYNMNGSIVK